MTTTTKRPKRPPPYLTDPERLTPAELRQLVRLLRRVAGRTRSCVTSIQLVGGGRVGDRVQLHYWVGEGYETQRGIRAYKVEPGADPATAGDGEVWDYRGTPVNLKGGAR